MNIKNKSILVTGGAGCVGSNIIKKLENIIVLGNSLGGHVALVCSVEFPEQLKLMILIADIKLIKDM